MDRAVLAKIRKCLALAGSDNPHEASNALRQAKALMRQHGVAESDVETAAVQEAAAKTARQSTPPVWLRFLADTVATAFGCRHFHRHGWRCSGEWVFLGVEPRAEIASYAFTVLRRQLSKARANYRRARTRGKAHGRNKRADDYAWGWVLGVREQVDRFAEAVPAVVDQYLGEHYSANLIPLKGRGDRRPSDMGKVVEGMIDGAKVKLHQGVGAEPVRQIGHADA